MRMAVAVGAALLVGFLAGWVLHSSGGGGDGSEVSNLSLPASPAWIENDLPAGLREAQARGRPVLVFFTGHGHSDANLVERAVLTQGRIRARIADVVPVRILVNGEVRRVAAQEACRRFHIDSIPTFLVLASDGRELGRVGFEGGSLEAYARALESWLTAMEQLDSARAQ